MGMPDTNADQHYTYGDYLKWPADERWEIIEGRAYAMTPSPTEQHQRISMNLTALLLNYFAGKTCRLYAAPFDVRLPRGAEDDELVDTIVQPDLLVVCDRAKIEAKGIRGAPDLVIEILSESTAQRDMDEKLTLYEKHGMRCYIIVDPWGKILTVRYLEANGGFGAPEFFTVNMKLPVRIFEGLTLDLGKIFGNI